jgi:endonuclease/exonuclease/phosphatase family metal-dependent hydrolase
MTAVRPRLRRRVHSIAVFLALVTLSGCTGGYAIARRDTAGLSGPAWFSPTLAADRSTLARWSAGVGPPIVRTSPTQESSPADTLCVISWNTAIGAGDVTRLLDDVRRERGNVPVILLLQEAYREGPEVPEGRTLAASFAGRLGGKESVEIEKLAETLGMNLYYVPSMRNGAPWETKEDRGNAILSSLPLEELNAIELPFERQRRVAVAATVSGTSTRGRPWRLRVVSVHLDNLVGLRRGWFVGGEFARVRQTRALLDYVRGDSSVILAGDFNTWFGFAEPAYSAIARDFPDTDASDRQPTFMGMLRLDHMFFRLPDGWRGTFKRGANRYGSDHYPLVGEIDLN